MFGLLKKKLNDIVKKFSKPEEERAQMPHQLKDITEEAPIDVSVPASAQTQSEGEKIADMLVEAGKEIEEMERAEGGEEKIKKTDGTALEGETETTEREEDVHEERPGDVFENIVDEAVQETEREVIHEPEKISEKENILENAGEPVEVKEILGEDVPEINNYEILEEKTEPEIETSEEIPVSDIEKMADEVREENRFFDPKEELISEEIIAEPVPEKKTGFLQKIFGKKKDDAEKLEGGTIIEQFTPEAEVAEIAKKEEKRLGLLGRITEKEMSRGESEKIADELKIALLESDVALEVSENICSALVNDITGKIIRRGETEKIIKDSLRKSMISILDQGNIEIEDIIEKAKSEGRPATIMFLGFNGTGKTTTLAKIAYHLKKRGYNSVLAAGDTFRAASIEQLEIHASRIGTEMVKQKYGSDSAAVIFDAKEHAKSHGFDVVLADTAGRSHSNINLMDELGKVVRVNKPDLKILVLDSLTGNDIVEQSQRFNEAVGVDGIILTKADVYEKGGAALSAVHTIRKPIIYMGIGQGYENLRKFDAEEVVDSILS